MTSPGALFDMEPVPASDPPAKISPDKRRTLRQAAAIRTGMHPLSLVLAGLRLHPDAGRDPAERTAGPRCGGCRFYGHYGHNSWQKCLHGYDASLAGTPAHRPPPRVSGGPVTDIRAWWPGCRDWQAAR